MKLTGTGKKAVEQLRAERKKTLKLMGRYIVKHKYPIDLNAIPQIDVSLENGYTKGNENGEWNKNDHDDSIRVTATTVPHPGNGRS